MNVEGGIFIRIDVDGTLSGIKFLLAGLIVLENWISFLVGSHNLKLEVLGENGGALNTEIKKPNYTLIHTRFIN